MKKNKTYMWLMSATALACSLGLASCDRDRDSDIDLSNAMRIIPERNNSGSKTYIEGSKTYWINGDKVAFNGAETSVTVSGGEYYILNVDNSSDMYAMSPFSAYVSGSSTVTMSYGASYVYSSYSGHQQTSLRMVGYAPAGASEMKFMHVGGMVAVTVNNSNTSLPLWLEKITVTSDKYKLRGNVEVEIPATEGEAPTVAPVTKGASDNYVSLVFRGSETVAASGSATYYIPCLPTGDDNHFTIKVEGFYYYPAGNTTGLLDDNYIHSTFEKTSTSTKELKRGHIAPATVALHSNIGTSGNCTAEKVYHGFDFLNSTTAYFSKGNLYFQGSSKKYSFADQQYNYVGKAAGNTTSKNRATNTSYIDLYGYGTSGYKSDSPKANPYETSTNYSEYCTYGLASSSGKYYDWGRFASVNTYNGTANFSFVEGIVGNNGYDNNGTWRVLYSYTTNSETNEWYYMLYLRTASTVNGVSNARFTLAQVDGKNGLMIFPNSFTAPSGIIWGEINGTSSQTVVDLNQWRRLESRGCVFLPCAGQRDGTTVNDAGTVGYYHCRNANCYYLKFTTSNLYTNGGGGSTSSRYLGASVRLVRLTHP